MANVIEKTGKTVEEAIQAAAEELGVAESELEVEVLETPSKRLFGLFGETPAKIRASVKVSEPLVAVMENASTIEEPARAEVPFVTPEIEPVLEPSPVEEPQISERDRLIDAAEDFLQEVFAAMKLEVTVEVEEFEDSVELNLSGKGLGVLIGRRGQALDALQYLLNLAVNRKSSGEKIFFPLDVEDYRRRREEALIKLAKGVAERVIKTRREVRLEPMSRHERKIVHSVLQDNDRIETHSTGEEPYRCVIV
ncbi:MAG: Jag N-terminal domain-containing protein, partial [Selenomonadaceae bacterium]|nr:Jag N-terminal domain-containing protein [Selenomonadaceae bacterium]